MVAEVARVSHWLEGKCCSTPPQIMVNRKTSSCCCGKPNAKTLPFGECWNPTHTNDDNLGIYIYIWICDISFSIKRTRNINRTIERCCFPMFLQTFLQEVTSPLFPSGKEFPFKKICEYASNRDRPAWPCLADRAGVIHGSSLCSSSNSSNKFGFQRGYIYIYIIYI